MTACDLLISARWIAPVVPGNRVFEHHSIVISDGRIVTIEPTEQATRNFQPKRHTVRETHLITPGFVNAHTHAGMSLFRGLAEDLPLEDWLNRRVFPLERQWVDEALVRDAASLACAEMLSGGTTCFADMYFYPDATIEAANEARIRAVIGLPAMEGETPWGKNFDEQLSKGMAVFDKYRSYPRLRFQWAPDSPNGVSDAGFTRLKTLTDQLELCIHTHLQETEQQARQSEQQFGLRPLERLKRLGLLDINLSLAHAVHMSTEDIQDLADAGAHVVHCPNSNAKLGSGCAPITAMRQAGVTVALGTDSAVSNNRLDMLAEMRMAALSARQRERDAGCLSAHDTLAMATIDGARALGLSADLGSIESGKFADLACVDLDLPGCWPVYDPVTQLVFAADRSQISDTWVAGEAVYSQRQLVTINASRLRERCQEWQQRIG